MAKAAPLGLVRVPDEAGACAAHSVRVPVHLGRNADPASSFTAEDLQIAGISAMSSVDWPGKLVATVFCQGCPWACPYCHNHAIIDPRIPGVVAWSSVTALMERRHGLLDGVVFSGGEATRQWALIPAMRQIRQMGFDVGLHTAGPYPARLARLLDEGLVDWVGLDIKALPGASYEAVAGRQGAGEKAWESLDVLMSHPEVAHEVRLTLDPSVLGEALEIARRCKAAGVRSFAVQEVRLQGVRDSYAQAYADAADVVHLAWEDQLAALTRDIDALAFEAYELRRA
ncbi:anaerobic ribonucleoside-triphosphate reductase activating protein [Schaalia canis]